VRAPARKCACESQRTRLHDNLVHVLARPFRSATGVLGLPYSAVVILGATWLVLLAARGRAGRLDLLDEWSGRKRSAGGRLHLNVSTARPTRYRHYHHQCKQQQQQQQRSSSSSGSAAAWRQWPGSSSLWL
jgi:hypothetical protein